ncbi:cyclopropane-fatty-acyl-phospholipid synthase family protein [Paraburkholderia jirisanensis]
MTQRPPVATALDRWVRRVRDTLDLPAQLRIAGGRPYALGRSAAPTVEIVVRDRTALPLLFDAHLDALAEAYVKRRIDVHGPLSDIVEAATRLATLRKADPAPTADHPAQRPASANPDTDNASDPNAPADNEHAQLRYHYDLSNDFYRLWLDDDLVYTPARFEHAGDTLENAQRHALDRTLDELQLAPGHMLLDVNCAWGALVIRAAQRHGVRCIGITQAENQYQLATERVRAAGLSERIEIRLADYRTLAGRFERIASVGLGAPTSARELTRRFAKLHQLLADDGIVVAHSLTSAAPGAQPDALPSSDLLAGRHLARYVFPAAPPPPVSFTLQAMQHNGLESLGMENLRSQHALTLQCWLQRFERNAPRIRETIGETKYRIWRVYLAGRAYASAAGRMSLYQIVGQKADRAAADAGWMGAGLSSPAPSQASMAAPASASATGTPHPSLSAHPPQLGR